jgi:hypothetical protein
MPRQVYKPAKLVSFLRWSNRFLHVISKLHDPVTKHDSKQERESDNGEHTRSFFSPMVKQIFASNKQIP